MRKSALFVVAALALFAVIGCGRDCDVVPVAPVIEDDCGDDRDRDRDHDDGGRDSLVAYPWPRPPK